MPVTQEQKEQAIATLAKMISLLGLRAEVRDASHDDLTVLSVQTDTPGRLIGRKGQYLESLELVLNRIIKKRAEDFPGIAIDIDGYQRGAGAAREPREHDGRERDGRDRGPRDRDRGPRERGPRDGAPRERGPRERGPRDYSPRERAPQASSGPGTAAPAPAADRDEAIAPELERMALDAAKEVRLWGAPKTLGPFAPGVRRAIHVVLRGVPQVEAESGPDEGSNMKKVIIRLATPGKPDGAGAGQEAGGAAATGEDAR